MTGYDIIAHTLAQIAARHGDVCLDIFARLYAMDEAFEPMFDMDTDGGVRRSMLTTSLNCVRGIAKGDSNTPRYLIEAARMIHDGYGLSKEQVNLFFVAMRDTYRDLLAADWSSGLETAWENLLEELFATGRSDVGCGARTS